VILTEASLNFIRRSLNFVQRRVSDTRGSLKFTRRWVFETQ